MSPVKKSIRTQLAAHYAVIKNIHIRDLFIQDTHRGKNYSRHLCGLNIDYSKNIISAETLSLLVAWAIASNVEESTRAMFAGEKINVSEDRAVLHTALRSKRDQYLKIDNIDVIAQVHAELDKMEQLVISIHDKSHRGWTNKSIDTFVNIGIGGSDLGAKMVVDALVDYRLGETRSFFISNIDYQVIESLQKTINPETTLFLISSKSFHTIETITNATTLIAWMQQLGCNDLHKHFFAITKNRDAATEFGIKPDNIFSLWNWVGGRFSLWSAVGLPIALAIGFDNFKGLLTGARAVDEHFLQTPLENNIPVILALIDYWYADFFDAQTHAFIPYDESLKLFPDYLSQLFMESNGKSVDLHGHFIEHKTMPVTWGSTGLNSQHAYAQLLHQGTHLVPIDFLVPLTTTGNRKHHEILLANCLAQSRALMQGATHTDPNQHCVGNRPSTTILYSALTPHTLGALIALYEHRTFVQGLLWQINAFDQWGVELGKKLAVELYQNLTGKKVAGDLDSSTQNLIELYTKSRQ